MCPTSDSAQWRIFFLVMSDNKHIPSPLLSNLLAKLVDRGLSDVEMAQLEGIIRKSPAALEYYRLYLSIHLDLSEDAPRVAAVPPVGTNWMRMMRVPWAVAALLALSFGISLWAPWSDRRQATGEVLAVTKVTQNVRWSLPQSPATGIDLKAGRIELTAGSLAMAMRGGQIVTISAPSDFEIIDDTEVSLHRGKASLRIIGSGAPIGIRVPRGKVLDLGTEFSVNVAPDGTADVWVFEGKVLASLTDATSIREDQPLTAGQSVRMGVTLMPSPAKPVDFIRPLFGWDGEASPSSGVIAHFSEEFPSSTLGSGQPYGGTEKPPNGWNYLWNPSGTLGVSASYQPLAPNTVNTFPSANGGGIFPMFTHLGNVAFNSPGQSDFRVGRIARTSIHPGKSLPGKDYRAIIAYTIQPGEGGEIRISNSSLAKYRVDGQPANGVDLDVYVNDTPLTAFRKSGFQSLAPSRFDGTLGKLAVGDTVFVMLGNNGDELVDGHDAYDAFDACVIDFQLEKAP
jgi:hypothetical protein